MLRHPKSADERYLGIEGGGTRTVALLVSGRGQVLRRLEARHPDLKTSVHVGDTAAVTALLDRLLHHAHVLKCGPRSWRTKVHADLQTEEPTK